MAISVARTIFTGNPTSLVVNLPVSPSAGDLILIAMSLDGSTGYTRPSGFTSIYAATNITFLDIAWKEATGSEGSSVTYTLSTGENGVAHAYVVPAAEWHGTTAPEAGTGGNSGVGTPNPPALNPAGWDAEDTIWFVFAGGDGQNLTGVDAYPTNYTTNGIFDTSGAANTMAVLASSYRINNAASEDPGIVDFTGSDDSQAVTVAVRPTSAGGTTTPQAASVAATGVPSIDKGILIEIDGAVALGVATITSALLLLQAAAATAIGLASLSTLEVLGKNIAATAIGVASLATQLIQGGLAKFFKGNGRSRRRLFVDKYSGTGRWDRIVNAGTVSVDPYWRASLFLERIIVNADTLGTITVRDEVNGTSSNPVIVLPIGIAGGSILELGLFLGEGLTLSLSEADDITLITRAS